jgi:hypothetical protein
MSDPAIEIDYIGGTNPVIAEGTIGGELWCFKATGAGWVMAIGSAPDYSGQYDATVRPMPQYVALEIIADCIRRYVTGDQE